MPPKRKAAGTSSGVVRKRGRRPAAAALADDSGGDDESEVTSSTSKADHSATSTTTSSTSDHTTTTTTTTATANTTESESKPPTKAKGGASKAKAGGKKDVNTFDYYADQKPHKQCTEPAGLTISSWNVAGIRAWLKKDGLKYLRDSEPDILCLQEVKAEPKDIPLEAKAVEGYKCYWSPCSSGKKGYSGVGLYTKEKPHRVTYGIGIEEHDKEGRVITAEYDDFYLVCAYVPNSGQGLKRLDYRATWDSDFLDYVKALDAKKPVIYTGDLNVAHLEYDLANPDSNRNKTAGFTDQERQAFTDLLDAGFVDSYRWLHPHDTGKYTYWSFRGNCRAKNVGWRLDYFVVSERIAAYVCDSRIDDDQLDKQSDHCPLTLQMAPFADCDQ